MTQNLSSDVIAELVIYPVKSLQGISLQSAEVTEQGLKWDRHWMIVNEDGQFATQRHFAKMATIATKITDSHLVLAHPDHDECSIPLTASDAMKANERQVNVWKSECLAYDEGSGVSAWLTKVLGKWRGQKLSLVRMATGFKRPVSGSHTEGASNSTLFSDGYPFLVTTTASLDELNKRLSEQAEQPIPMSRFRANLVVDNSNCADRAFIENRSSALVLSQSDVGLNLCKPCERCKVPSIDQVSGLAHSPQQPLKTLFSMDHVQQKGAYFGHNAVLDEASKSVLTQTQPLVIKVGDSVVFK